MAWIRTVKEEEAKGITQRYYEVSKSRRGFVSSTTKIMSIREGHLRANQSLFISLVEGESGLSRTEKEMIAVRVSALNNCRY